MVLGKGNNTKLEIIIKLDKEKNLHVLDRGIGIIKEYLIKKLIRTIARSEALVFIEKKHTRGHLTLIGQFGVRFYLVYLVPNYVKIIGKNQCC